MGRLAEEDVSGSAAVGFAYDGASLIAELDAASGVVARRYVHGPGADEALVWYEGSGTSDRRFMVADERGSVVLVTDGLGDSIAQNRYSIYGRVDGQQTGRFGFTGQTRITGTDLWHFKARAYDPKLGRFLQPDPIGYGDGLNMYAYAGGDPINATDPTGLGACGPDAADVCKDNGTGGTTGDDVLTVYFRPPPEASFDTNVFAFYQNNPIAVGFNFSLEGAGGASGVYVSKQNCGPAGDRKGYQQPSSPIRQAYDYGMGLAYGYADGFTFGAFSAAVNGVYSAIGVRGINPTADFPASSYGPATWAVAGFGAGRLAYAGSMHSMRYLPISGQQAVRARNIAKGGMSGAGPLHPGVTTYQKQLSKYGSDAAVKQAASRTNKGVNKVGASMAASGTTAAATKCEG